MKIFQKYSDRDILNAIEKGQDEKVLSFLYSDVLPKVKGFILKNQGSVDEAKDIFQDGVIRFYDVVKEGKFEGKSSISTYIFAISKNLWINHMKKKNRYISEEPVDFKDDSVNLLDDLISQERVNAIDAILKQLGEGCEQLLKYSIYDNLSMKEICEKMGYSSENVAKTYNYRCKQKLIQLVSDNQTILNLFGQ
ncbi:MAG: RNA polymerase sigma factor [Cytophagaceae bacterium]|nr:RNA polymerase sigma factor [Cytophagaceae bacterium]